MHRRVAAALAILSFGARWTLAASATSTIVSSIGRALCFPPYWPDEQVLRCRPNGLGDALMHLPLDVLVTTVMIFFAALPLGLAVAFARPAVRGFPPGDIRRVGFALAISTAWIWLMRRLETSYLDFIIGGYAIAAGALMGALLGASYLPRRRR